jgi:hypothetical protein
LKVLGRDEQHRAKDCQKYEEAD